MIFYKNNILSTVYIILFLRSELRTENVHDLRKNMIELLQVFVSIFHCCIQQTGSLSLYLFMLLMMLLLLFVLIFLCYYYSWFYIVYIWDFFFIFCYRNKSTIHYVVTVRAIKWRMILFCKEGVPPKYSSRQL